MYIGNCWSSSIATVLYRERESDTKGTEMKMVTSYFLASPFIQNIIASSNMVEIPYFLKR